ncbi:MAG: PqqD family protein [Gaiellaceae bacterium]
MAERTIRLRDEGLHWRLVEDELIVLDATAGKYFSLNRTAALLWPALEGGATRTQLVRQLAARWPDVAEHGADDVDTFISWLEERGLCA